MKRYRKRKSSQPTLRRRNVVMSKMELARQFYWCDEHAFYLMRTPISEVLAFINYKYEPEDCLEDVMYFFPRIQRAQSHGKSYIAGRMLCKLAVEDPEDALPGFEYAPEPEYAALDDE